MLEIGWSELLLLAIVAIVVVGPKELPGMMRTAGKALGGLRRTAGEFRAQFDEAVRQSELESLRAEVESVRRVDPAMPIKKAIEKPELPPDERKGVEATPDMPKEQQRQTEAPQAEPEKH